MKKITAFLFALTMVFTSTACGGKKESRVKESPAAVTISQTTYGIEEVPLDIDAKFGYNMAVYDDGICLFYQSFDDELKFIRTDKDFKTVSSAVILEKDSRGAAYNVNPDGSFDMVIAETDFEFEFDDEGIITNWEKYYAEAEFTLRLISCDNEGNITNQCDIEEIGKYFDLETSGLIELIPCGEDSLMLNFGNGLAIFGRDGGIIDIDAGNQYNGCSIAQTADGNILFTQFDSYGYMKPDSVDIPSDMKYSEELSGSYTSPVKGSGAFKAYFSLSGGLYGMTENEELIMVVDYDKSLMSSSSGLLKPFGDGKFVSYTADGSTNNKIMVYTRRPDDYVEKRKALELWMVERSSSQMHNIANDFCALNDNYYINIRESVSFEDVPTAILTGDGPDILYYDRSGDMYKLVNLGGLADLSTYLDGDTGISRDELMPNVLEAYEYHGGLYALPEQFCVQLISAKKDFIGDEYRNWTINDFIEKYDSRPQGMEVFEENYLSTILCSEDVWTDHEKATCNYNSSEFIRVLEICKESEKNIPEIDYNDLEALKAKYSMFKDDKAMLYANAIDLIGMWVLIRDISQRGLSVEDISLLNIPGSGDGRMYMGESYSILANSDCPDGAWEFISYILNEENQNMWASHSHPINKKVFEKTMENCIDPPEGRRIRSANINGEKFTFEDSASEEQVKRYNDFVLNCRTLAYDDRDIDDIFYEEYERFLNDEITAEECAYNLQNRVEILLSENS